MKEAINLTTIATIDKISLQLASYRGKNNEYQIIILPTREYKDEEYLERQRKQRKPNPILKRWVHGYKIVKDCGDHLEEINPCKVEKTIRANADIVLAYYNNQSYYKLPEEHRFIKK